MGLDDFDGGAAGQESKRSSRVRSMVAATGFLALGSVALAVAAMSCTGGKKDADRLSLRNASAKFEASPGNSERAEALAAEYEARGMRAEAEQVRKRHAAAVSASADAKEKDLRARLAAASGDDQALGQLVELLARRTDLAGAKAEYTKFVERNPSPKRRASFGSWLWRNGFAQEAIPELLASLKEVEDPYARAYLGLALFDVGKKKQARDEIVRALEAGVEMDVLPVRLYAIETELGASGKPKPATRTAPGKPRPAK
jgi:Flp pilus assembly protein TadD